MNTRADALLATNPHRGSISNDEMDTLAEEWLHTVSHTVQKWCPFKPVHPNARPWWTPALTKAVQRRKQLFKCAQQSNAPQAWEEYNQCRKEVKDMVRAQQREAWKRLNAETMQLIQEQPAKAWANLKRMARRQRAKGA